MMEISSLKHIDQEAPPRGYCLCYARDKVIFEKYETLERIKEKLDNRELLELHLFDKIMEYRALSTASKRFSDGVIEHVVMDEQYQNSMEMSEELKYGSYDVDSVVNKSETDTKYDVPDKLRVRNYYEFNKFDALMIVDYRLIMEE